MAYPGLSRYRRAEFDLGIGSIAWRQRIGANIRGDAGYQYEHRSYNPDFIERTSHTHQAWLRLEIMKLPDHGSIGAYGGYRLSNARATDADTIADDADVSYHGIITGLGWRMDFVHNRTSRLGIGMDFDLGTRAYDSNLTTDKYHYKRDDTSSAVDISLRWAAPPHWAVRGIYRLDHNSAHLGSLAPPGSETGSYTENQFGLAVDWSGSLWRQPKATDGEEE